MGRCKARLRGQTKYLFVTNQQSEFRQMGTAKTPAERLTTDVRPPTMRSRTANGKQLFAEGGDGRGPWARRLRDVFALHLSDLGGVDMASEAERSILRRAAVLTI